MELKLHASSHEFVTPILTLDPWNFPYLSRLDGCTPIFPAGPIHRSNMADDFLCFVGIARREEPPGRFRDNPNIRQKKNSRYGNGELQISPVAR